jgi:DNA mismatch repair protein MutL
MPRIRLMPDALANQIAAGEVVERPASVVRELVENSLDAGARSISVRIEKSGKEAIRVSDDGIGMSAEDARLAVQRHATSKLFAASDLSHISSLGFRGEALPSIASVSRFTLRTREPEADAGTEILIEGGTLLGESQVGIPAGTMVAVDNLFFNVPARRKFLRADVTETSHTAAAISSLAACYPDVRFRLDHGKRSILDAPSVGSRRERLYQLEKSWAESAVVVETEIGGLSIEAWLAPPAESRGAVSRLHLFVNGRPVKDRVLHHAVVEAYRQVSSRSGTPLVYLFLELAPDRVDVNVHPSKAEVRFVDQQFVHQAVFSAVKNSLQGERRAPEVMVAREWATTPFAAASSADSDRDADPDPDRDRHAAPATGLPPLDGRVLAEMLLGEASASTRETPAFAELASLPPRPMGQFRHSFIVATDAESVWLIDQHAAHERILYEDLVERGATEMGQQLLLTPVPLDLAPAERVTMEEEIEDLISFGYDVEAFGADGFVVRAVPASLAGLDPVRLIRAALGERERECRSSTVREAGSRIAARLACHAAIKVNFELAMEKMQYLVSELWRARQPTVCPHGRPTTLRIGKEQLERSFGRI